MYSSAGPLTHLGRHFWGGCVHFPHVMGEKLKHRVERRLPGHTQRLTTAEMGVYISWFQAQNYDPHSMLGTLQPPQDFWVYTAASVIRNMCQLLNHLVCCSAIASQTLWLLGSGCAFPTWVGMGQEVGRAATHRSSSVAASSCCVFKATVCSLCCLRVGIARTTGTKTTHQYFSLSWKEKEGANSSTACQMKVHYLPFGLITLYGLY